MSAPGASRASQNRKDGMYEGVDTVVLYDELAYQDVLPVQWQASARPRDRFELTGLEEANLLLLQAAVAMEEHPARDKNEDLGPLAGELARMDFKLNLVLQLLSRLVHREPMPPPRPVQFNALGASWTLSGPAPTVGSHGLLRIQLRSSLPQPLELPAEVAGVDGMNIKVRFPELSEAVAELIQRLAFLRHRRHIAGVRKARSP
jgi:hypothetical protein